MVSSLASSSFIRRGRSSTSDSNEFGDSNGSSSRLSRSSSRRKASQSSSQLDDWSDGFTGIVDLDRRMRELAMAEQSLSALGSSEGLNVYEPYTPPSTSWTEKRTTQRNSSTDSRPGSGSQSSLATGRSFPSLASNLNTQSCSATIATSRFSQDSRAHSSLLSKKRSSTANTVDSLESAHSPLRLAPLPAPPSAFGNYRLTDASACDLSRSTRPSGTFSLSSWSSVDDGSPRAPHPATTQLEPLTPGTAAAATWTDPSAPSYFPAGLSGDSGKKPAARSLRRKVARAPLPRLVSGEVVSSPVNEGTEFGSQRALFDKQEPRQPLGLGTSTHTAGDPFELQDSGAASSAHHGTHALKRSAQSLALNLRFKIIRAKRKVHRTGSVAADLLAPAHTASQRSSVESSLST